jgi:hypothetical protein
MMSVAEGSRTMKFHNELDYEASPEDVRAMLADPAFREKVCRAQGVTGCTVSVDPAGDKMSVVIDTTRPAEGVPGFAKKFVGDTIAISQREVWADPTNASLAVTVPGKPGQFDGHVSLNGDVTGTVETVSGDVKVSIPLIGGKLERLVSDMLGSALRIENRVGKAWLAGDR